MKRYIVISVVSYNNKYYLFSFIMYFIFVRILFTLIYLIFILVLIFILLKKLMFNDIKEFVKVSIVC